MSPDNRGLTVAVKLNDFYYLLAGLVMRFEGGGHILKVDGML